jgi:hypothetical protein
MAANSKPPPGDRPDDPGLHRILLDDLRRTDLGDSMRESLRDLYEFYLDDERRQQLASMSRFRRWLRTFWWSFKALFLKLSPARRVMLAAGLILAILGRVGAGDYSADLRIWGVVLLVLILMLELKDKLLARDEIDVARRVQLDLLPRHHPDLEGWSIWSYTRPANDVGGDLVDYLEFSPGRLDIALGDVAGKGMGAALLMAKLQATMRALAADCSRLDELGTRVNAIFHRDGLENRFATLFYICLEAGSGRLRYLNAGHNPALLQKHDGIEELGASGVPLGILPGTRYCEGVAELQPGELVVAYSDGLTEATSAAGEEYGDRRLRELLPRLKGLSVAEAGRLILHDVERFTASERYADDLSLVLLLRTG